MSPELSDFLISNEAMKTLPASKSISTWQSERTRVLLNIFSRIDGAIRRREKISQAIRRASRYYHGREFKSDPSRRIRLAPVTIRHLWDVWNHGGMNPAALKLKYRARPPYIPRALMIRFIQWFSENRLPSIRKAWRQFSALKRNARKTQGITYQMVCWHLRSAGFYQIQNKLKIVESEQAAKTDLMFAEIGHITDRLPARAPRRRLKPGTNFQI